MLNPDDTVFAAVSAGLTGLIQLIDQYTHSQGDLDALQSEIEALDGWNWEQRVDETLHRLHLDPQARISAPVRRHQQARRPGPGAGDPARRAAARRAHQPPGPRLHRVAGRTADRLQGQRRHHHPRPLLSGQRGHPHRRARPGQAALLPRQLRRLPDPERRAAGARGGDQAKADKLLAQEEVWIRKGVEARRTRAQARIVRLDELRAKRQARREVVGSVKMDVDSGAASGKLVAELTHVSKTFGERCIVRRLFRHHPARRQDRPARAQRRGQDHPAQADSG